MNGKEFTVKYLSIITAAFLLFGLCSCAETPASSDPSNTTTVHTTTTTDQQPDDADSSASVGEIPANTVRFRIVTTDGEPVSGAEMGCTSPAVNGERPDDYCLMGETDENGCLLWPAELGDIDFDVSIPGQKAVTFNRIITKSDFGAEIVFVIDAIAS